MMLVLLFATFLILTYVFSGRRDQRYDKRIKAESTTLRIYIIDVKNNKVTYFNRSQRDASSLQSCSTVCERGDGTAGGETEPFGFWQERLAKEAPRDS